MNSPFVYEAYLNALQISNELSISQLNENDFDQI